MAERGSGIVAWRFTAQVRYPDRLRTKYCYVGCSDEKRAQGLLDAHGDIVGGSQPMPLTKEQVNRILGRDLEPDEVHFDSR